MACSAPPRGMGKRDAMTLRAAANSLVVADSIVTSSSRGGAGVEAISTSSRNPPSGNEAERAPDVDAMGGAEEVAPWLVAACWGGEAVSIGTVSGAGLWDRPLPEGLELLWGEPPAKAAPRDRTRRPGMRGGGGESLTAWERVGGTRPDITNQTK